MGRNEIAKGKYRVEGLPEESRSGIEVKITGPNGESEFSQNDVSGSKFAFTATEAGAHKVCFTNNANVNRRIDFEFLAGVEAKDYADIAKKEHLKPLELELRKLEDRIAAVHSEMQYQREREETHRNTNESTNSRVVYYSILTIAAAAAVSITQAIYIYTYMQKKNIIKGGRGGSRR